MNTAPELDEREIVSALAAGWGFDATSLVYAAVGFGSHHWIAVDHGGAGRFVTVDVLANRAEGSSDVAFARLSAAFETARRLRERALEFVVAPLPDTRGDVLQRLTDGFSMAVFPLVDGTAGEFGEWPSAGQRREVRTLIERLHDATSIVEGVAAREDFALPGRARLTVALEELHRPWATGPYAEPTRRLLQRIEGELVAALDGYEGLVAQVRSDPAPWVITHGEPHPGNVIWSADGPRLVDWDTALIAPAARDWWQLASPDDEGGGDREAAGALYRLRWDLADIAVYVGEFRLPHGRTTDTVASWRNLEHCARRIAPRVNP